MIDSTHRRTRALPAPHGTRFVILSSQRTGSTLLVRSLDMSPRIQCAGELFRKDHGIYHPEFRYPRALMGSVSLGRLCDVFAAPYRVRKHLNKFYCAADMQVEAVGFKLMVSQLRRYPTIPSTLNELNVLFLILYREDSLATALSYCRAKATGVFHSDRTLDAKERPPVVVAEGEFERVLRKCKFNKHELLRLHGVHGGLLLRYEDMVEDWDTFIDKLGAQLGISGLRVSPALSKLQSGVDSARIANEDVLRARFGDTSLFPASGQPWR